MAHFARISELGVVETVTVVSNEDILDSNGAEVEALGVAICEEVVGPGIWVQTSFNNSFRKRFAGIGMTYDAEHDAFLLPKPYPSWILDNNCDWQAPTQHPSDGGKYSWDEDQLKWVEVSE